MKKLLISLGVVCSLGFYSCDDDDPEGNTGLIATDAQIENLGDGYLKI